MATFIIVDGDRAKNVPGELAALQNLHKYCYIHNKRDNRSPYFLIVNSPDFEYISCLHDRKYSGGDTTRHIEKIFTLKFWLTLKNILIFSIFLTAIREIINICLKKYVFSLN